LEEFLGMLPHLAEHSHMLRTAARWHDLGKGHEAFQTGMREANEKLDTTKLWAKSGSKKRLRHGRPYFRHELVSALATLGDFPFLVSYMMAAHHGRVRLAIRSVPGEADGTVLGVCDTDTLDPIDIGNGIVSPPRGLSLNPMKLGDKHSWTASALALLQEHGPFRLAYLEAVLRAADAEASRRGDLP
jgi:CRISPR-associated endonuclease/helicase Cas3